MTAKSWLLAGMASFLITVTSPTSAISQVRTIKGIGPFSCGEVNGNRSMNLQAFQWIMGYLSAMSPLENGSFEDNLTNMSKSYIDGIIAGVCSTNANTTVNQIAFRIYRDIGGEYFIR